MSGDPAFDSADSVTTQNVKCRICKYDLRGQLQPPVPMVVLCPECGRSWVVADLTKKRDSRVGGVLSAIALGLIAFLGFPGLLALFALVTGGNGTLLFAIYPFLYITLAGIHIIITLVMAIRFSMKCKAPGVATTFFALSLVFDMVIVLMLASSNWAT